MNTTAFGREIEFGDIKNGQKVLIASATGTTYKGTVERYKDFSPFLWLEDGNHIRILESDRVWAIEELRIVEVDSIRLSQKPIAIYSKLDGWYISKRAPDSDPGPSPEDTDWTMFHSLAKSFSSVGEAVSYLQKYLTSHCEVVILQKR